MVAIIMYEEIYLIQKRMCRSIGKKKHITIQYNTKILRLKIKSENTYELYQVVAFSLFFQRKSLSWTFYFFFVHLHWIN